MKIAIQRESDETRIHPHSSPEDKITLFRSLFQQPTRFRAKYGDSGLRQIVASECVPLGLRDVNVAGWL